jgi:hypothetical protein
VPPCLEFRVLGCAHAPMRIAPCGAFGGLAVPRRRARNPRACVAAVLPVAVGCAGLGRLTTAHGLRAVGH